LSTSSPLVEFITALPLSTILRCLDCFWLITVPDPDVVLIFCSEIYLKNDDFSAVTVVEAAVGSQLLNLLWQGGAPCLGLLKFNEQSSLTV
jgi:hypothetical protein